MWVFRLFGNDSSGEEINAWAGMFEAKTAMPEFVETMVKIAEEATANVEDHEDDDDSDLEDLDKSLDELEESLLSSPSK